VLGSKKKLRYICTEKKGRSNFLKSLAAHDRPAFRKKDNLGEHWLLSKASKMTGKASQNDG
jgi:hypothetical protein